MVDPELNFFPVDNGDMTLFLTENGKYVVIDVNIRAKDDDILDVIEALKKKIKKDAEGRYYIDAFLLSHPDEDHCKGLDEHFYLGSPENYPKDSGKIFIREIWSSPMAFRRKPKNETLCKDAKAFNKEARRRVSEFRKGSGGKDGNRILILGEDEKGKTDDLSDILVKTGDSFSKINGKEDNSFEARLLAPDLDSDDSEEKTKNDSSVIMRIKLGASGDKDACKFLTGGDAGVAVWEKLYRKYKKENIEYLEYNILQCPHHCSWHSLSYDSWSDGGAKVSPDALNALSQAMSGATIVASSKKIKDGDADPPCSGAKKEYEKIVNKNNGEFCCTADNSLKILKFKISKNGLQKCILAAPLISTNSAYTKPVSQGSV